MIYKFFDTNALLENFDEALNEDMFFISSVVFSELEEIKTSSRKDDDTKFKARKVTRWLFNNEDKYDCVFRKIEHEDFIKSLGYELSNDNLIIAAYVEASLEIDDKDELIFVTNDLLCYNIAKNLFFIDKIKNSDNKTLDIDYAGFVRVQMNEEELSKWYIDKENKWELLDNQYLVIENENSEYIDSYKFLNNEFLYIDTGDYRTKMFGMFRPKDVYQRFAMDSLKNNKLTLLKGKAGTGKSMIAMNFLFSRLEKGIIEKIIFFVNSPKVRGTSGLGYYKGTKDEKLLDSTIGNFLCSKLGDKEAVIELIDSNQIVLLPMSDIRGYDTSGMKCGVYITEAQNTSIDIMKLALQRIGDDSICVIDGDYSQQVDEVFFEGNKNGMKRLSEIFKGKDFYGEVELQTTYRSKIAEISELM